MTAASVPDTIPTLIGDIREYGDNSGPLDRDLFYRIADRLAALAPSAAVVDDLPGMWERSDLSGGFADSQAAIGAGDDEQFWRIRLPEYLPADKVETLMAERDLCRAEHAAAALARVEGPVDDCAADVSVWTLIDLAKRCGAVHDEGDDGQFWTLDVHAFYALESLLQSNGVSPGWVNCNAAAPPQAPAAQGDGLRAGVVLFTGCADDFMEAVKALTEMRPDGEALHMRSPSADSDALHAWQRLNDTCRRLRACVEKLREVPAPAQAASVLSDGGEP